MWLLVSSLLLSERRGCGLTETRVSEYFIREIISLYLAPSHHEVVDAELKRVITYLL